MEDRQTNGFNRFSLSPELIDTLTLLGYDRPTEIQERVLPPALAGENVMARSGTGTGKTAAFGIPICEKVDWEENAPQALVLEPTRELTVQVRDELFHIGRKKRLKVPAVFGGFPIDKQIRTLKQKSHIVVGTPGRVMDHIRRDTLPLSGIRFFVIDEADLMLDMGFLEDVKQIMGMLPKDAQIMLFSATLEKAVRQMAEEFMPDAVSVIMESGPDQEGTVEEILYETGSEEKYETFIKILIHENPESGMIFCGTREMVNVLCRKMKKDRISCCMLHGELDQAERLKTVENFRTGQFRFLIATDVAARGIDFENITHVIQYDFPTGRETYVHRIGRTGRNGKSGRALSLVTEDDRRMKQMVETFLGRELPLSACPEPTEEEKRAFGRRRKEAMPRRARKGEALNRDILRLTIGGGKKSKMRAGDLVGTICSIPGVEPSDIGIIDVRESLTYVEILNGKGKTVLDVLQEKPIKGKVRKVRSTRGTF